MEKENQKDRKEGFSQGRRNLLKALATTPLLGAMAYGVYQKSKYEKFKNKIDDYFPLSGEAPKVPAINTDRKIRIGVIGIGNRGRYLLRALGFAEPDYVDRLRKAAEKDPTDKRYSDFMEQPDMGVEITGICDVFTANVASARKQCSNIYREGVGGKMGKEPKVYKTYKELLAADDIDAVIIATPDHWHAPMTIAAAKAGKHIYCEKPVSWSIPETYELYKAVKENNTVFQLGHQQRQIECNMVAKEIIDKGLIGPVSLVQISTNRNDPNGAWVYPIHKDASPETIDWNQFIGQAPWHDFSLERFFRWRCWWDYSTGLNGDLLTHEFDVINQVMRTGIPYSAVCSGGIYFFKDGRTVPDTMQVAYEFPKKNMTMLYSATQSSQYDRPRVMMGHDATMQVDSSLNVYVDPRSTKYADLIKQGRIDPAKPIYSYVPGSKKLDGKSTATEAYFAARGLLYTYRDGKRWNTTSLHLLEWLECMRQGGVPSCNIDEAFCEGMAAHMATQSYLQGRKMYWDEDKQAIVDGEPVKA